ncbi:MAG: tRNA 5-hydroxyuridine modification protein YegQ [Pseudomonadales bacterium]|jgi:putative protease|nr:tRNA 5-hydroxyuridine modification protein YegQ [Gammaproteobacteria bacterium]MBK9667188.1 tRNA 5-hydroxyuridine modification protein YegQ [Gammaproteobacteria bacterium]MBP6053295.1 tRNA 5-hydroxyuridine modification protein YegQ [Pseudomonadales bacterium]MBP6228673.1 tRNA 5-hydroxyuridine modification protein YegQ [Pseudomonadales bacterium]
MPTPELLSPAGTFKSMQYAFAYGADAVYAGQPRYSLRVRNNDFSQLERIAEAVAYAHDIGKQFFIASNVSPHNDKLRSYLRDMEPVIEMRPDALIMADPGLIMMVRERWPDMPIHLSVQANAVNWATVKFWKTMGLTRIILSRELSLEEVAEIRQECPDIELEVFVHGALCIAYSGRCLLSGYITHRDSNQGACTNTCRWKYQAHEAEEAASGDVLAVYQPPPVPEPAAPDNRIYLLQEEGRPGEYMPAYEDEHGTYIMNSRDLRAIQHVQQLIDIGVDCLKIEGRTKSHYYVARTAQAYRRAIDDALAGKAFDMELMNELEKLASRGYTEGFYRRHPPGEFQNYERGVSRGDYQQFVGEVVAIDRDRGMLSVSVNNRFEVGDKLELMTTGGNCVFTLNELSNEKGERRTDAPGSGHVVQFPIPETAVLAPGERYAMLARYL